MTGQLNNRIFHVDALRGAAILMMLQGHFTYALLEESARSGPVYEFWAFCRGLTAPVFFTASGVVIVYLLLRKKDPDYRNQRMRKGLKRGLEVLMWGYLLRLNVFPVFTEGNVWPEFWRVDVLHCIGIGVLANATLFWVFSNVHVHLYRTTLLLIGIGMLLFEPVYSTWDYSHLPYAIQNYLTPANGSIFTLWPWLGYMFLGGFLGSLYNRLYANRKFFMLGGVLLLGIFFAFFSSRFFHWMGTELQWGVLVDLSYGNTRFMRLGHILLIYYLPFVLAEPLLKRIRVLNQMGQRTLTVYILHFILLYGSWFGLGLDDHPVLKKGIPAEWIFPAALAFIILVSWLTLRYHKWKDAGFVLKTNQKAKDAPEQNDH